MKESFYLKHDYNSRNDERVLRLRQKYNEGRGYAIYWMILEKLAESSEGRLRLSDIDVIAFELQMDSKWIADVVLSSGLFENDKVFFWSNRLLSDLAERDEKSKKAILANKIRWDRERRKLQTDSKRNPGGIQGKERIGKEKKGNEHASKKRGKLLAFGEGDVLMSSEEHKKLCTQIGGKAVDRWIADLENWKLSKGKTTKDDYRTILSWISREKKQGLFKVKADDFRASDFDTKEEYENIINRLN